jgi:hypothetical protein
MCKAILMLVLTGLSNGAMAEEWVAVVHTDDGGITVYGNQSATHMDGNIVRIWTLGDFKKAEQTGDNKQFLSLKEQYDYDCKGQLMRRLYATIYSGNMGRGNVVDSSPIDEKWQPVPPGSLNEHLWKFACGKN